MRVSTYETAIVIVYVEIRTKEIHKATKHQPQQGTNVTRAIMCSWYYANFLFAVRFTGFGYGLELDIIFHRQNVIDNGITTIENDNNDY